MTSDQAPSAHSRAHTIWWGSQLLIPSRFLHQLAATFADCYQQHCAIVMCSTKCVRTCPLLCSIPRKTSEEVSQGHTGVPQRPWLCDYGCKTRPAKWRQSRSTCRCAPWMHFARPERLQKGFKDLLLLAKSGPCLSPFLYFSSPPFLFCPLAARGVYRFWHRWKIDGCNDQKGHFTIPQRY